MDLQKPEGFIQKHKISIISISIISIVSLIIIIILGVLYTKQKNKVDTSQVSTNTGLGFSGLGIFKRTKKKKAKKPVKKPVKK
jgi:hypothetical protein